MADNFAGSGNVKVTSAGTPTTYFINQTITFVGNRLTETISNLTTGSWILLPTGSVATPRMMIFNNPSGSQGTIVIATSASLATRITTLQPNDPPAFIPWNGSTPLYCSASVVSSSIQYDLMY
jgi:hypothetical protein